MAARTLLGIAATLTLLSGCSSTFTPQTCEIDKDCGSGLVCDERGGQAVCLSVADAPLRIGMSAPISGPSQELGTEMKLGISLAFDAQNAKGGVRGRNLELVFRDDAYQPDHAEDNTRELLDVQPGVGQVKCPTTNVPLVAGQSSVSTTPLARGPNAVLALIGNVGTSTMIRSAPIAVETGSLFFGAFTGATKMLRDDLAGPCRKYVFNVRASYADEARAALEFFFSVEVPDAAHLMSFDQSDAFGDEGYDGFVNAYKQIKGEFSPPPADPMRPIPRFRYDRDSQESMTKQVTAAATSLGELLSEDSLNHTIGIFMTDTYGPATSFITGLRKWQYANDAEQKALKKASRLTLYFVNVSFVGPNALASRLKEAGTVNTPNGPVPFTDNVLISQVVPNYESDDSEIVQNYHALMESTGKAPSFTSLEGYVSARIFIAGLLAHQGLFTTDSLVETFEHLPKMSLGFGPASGFSPSDHGYSKSIWGTSLNADAAFHNRYFWTEGTPLQPFE